MMSDKHQIQRSEKMRTTAFLPLMAALCFPLAAAAFDFKGLELGAVASPADIKSKVGIRCWKKKRDGTQTCEGRSTVAGAVTFARVVVDADGTVQDIGLRFSEEDFSKVESGLREKFGEPSTERSEVQNRMGAGFNQVTHTWKNEQRDLVVLVRYANDINHSVLLFMTAKSAESDAAASKGDPTDL